MTIAALAIAIIWAGLLGTAYVARVILRRSMRSSVAMVIAAYAVLGTAILSWFGLSTVGLLSVTGMLVPCLAAFVTIRLYRPRRA